MAYLILVPFPRTTKRPVTLADRPGYSVVIRLVTPPLLLFQTCNYPLNLLGVLLSIVPFHQVMRRLRVYRLCDVETPEKAVNGNKFLGLAFSLPEGWLLHRLPLAQIWHKRASGLCDRRLCVSHIYAMSRTGDIFPDACSPCTRRRREHVRSVSPSDLVSPHRD